MPDMPNAAAIIIRKYNQRDRAKVRRINYDTAFMGEPASAFFEGEEIISGALTLYYTDYEPESCFVAESRGRVVGCLIGTKNKIAAEKVFQSKISRPLFIDALMRGIFLKRKNLIFIFRVFLCVLKGEFRMPLVTEEYPATLHINLEKAFRGLGIGSKLIAAFLDYLRQERVSGVHLATMTKGAGEFFSRQGFNLLYTARRSYFRHILHKDIFVYIYGKKL